MMRKPDLPRVVCGITVAVAASAATMPGCLAQPAKPTQAEAKKIFVPVVAPENIPDIELAPVPTDLRNPWPEPWEKELQQRAKLAISRVAGARIYGNTYFENEKRAYAYAMMDFLAGNRKKAVDFLQGEDANAKEWNAHTLGIDYFPAFTLKHQMRKYFYLGKYLDPAYKQRMFDAAKIWTEQDPLRRAHPNYKGLTGEGWTPYFKNSWVDVRSTDNLRYMRDTSVYLLAEEAGNEATRQLYKKHLVEHVQAMYNIGMGEWDSENYLGHSLAPWLNVYDFAKDRDVKLLAKAALDWICTAAAVKYYRGALNGPTKRDYYHPVPLEGAANSFAFYFGDYTLPDEKPEPDQIHSMTSAYRPPQAVVELARKNLQKPVELFISHPTYEHWKAGAADKPEYFETQYIGNSFLLGSLPTGNMGDVNGLKMLVWNEKRGADYFIPASGNAPTKITTSTNGKDRVAQFGSNILHLNAEGNAPFHFFTPADAKIEQQNNIWFFQFDRTWLAIHPINLKWNGENDEATTEVRKRATGATIFSAQGTGGKFCGYAMAVGEKESFGDYESFKNAAQRKAKLGLGQLENGIASFNGANEHTLKMQVGETGLPQIWRNNVLHDWNKHFALYQGANGKSPVEQGWKSGSFRVEAGGKSFSGKLSPDGKFTFANQH